MTTRRFRRIVALAALALLAVGQTLAGAHACTLGQDAIAAAEASAQAHMCCPDGIDTAPVSNDCKQHCSTASNASTVPVDVPAFGWVIGFVPKPAVGAAPRVFERVLAQPLAPPAPPPLATSGRLLI